MVCIGNSHLACVLLAAEKRGVAIDEIRLNGISRSVDSRRSPRVIAPGGLGDGEPRALVTNARRVFVFVGGLDHQAFGLREHPVPFDFVLPSAPHLPLDPDAQPIPSDAMRDLLARRTRPQLDTLRQVARAARGDVLLFESPPPPSVGWVAFQEERFARLAEAYRRSGKTNPVMDELLSSGRLHHSRLVRYKLWRLDAQIFADAAAELGVRVVNVPGAAVDEQGFLRAEFCGDPVHANAAYGDLVLDQMAEFT